jgi:hypothetical protein
MVISADLDHLRRVALGRVLDARLAQREHKLTRLQHAVVRRVRIVEDTFVRADLFVTSHYISHHTDSSNHTLGLVGDRRRISSAEPTWSRLKARLRRV